MTVKIKLETVIRLSICKYALEYIFKILDWSDLGVNLTEIMLVANYIVLIVKDFSQANVMLGQLNKVSQAVVL